jgi:phosphopentomutase
MPRAFLLILDSVGIGGAADAGDYFNRGADGALTPDTGADTLGHVAAACAGGGISGRTDGLRLPTLDRLGLGLSAEAATGRRPAGFTTERATGAWGYGVETSRGKDTPSGHWELAGVPVPFDWGYFPATMPAFPSDLIADLCDACDLAGVLGDCHASGTEIIAEFGLDHMRTRKPIVYTSADSVLQIAAHEDTFGLERLYQVCLTARELLDARTRDRANRPPIGRVIARPFVGTSPADFARTGNRRDYAVPPPEPTVLDRAKDAGREVIAIGKISDIYAGSGVTRVMKASGNAALFAATLAAQAAAGDGALVVTNFVDFDMLYGHRRDVAGYAAALVAFDAQLPAFIARMRDGDLAIITADHGCDPTWIGTDHTRETVPILAFGPHVTPGALGQRAFADVGETLARHLGLAPGRHGTSVL